MAASLSFIGHTCLGRTGSVKLSELNTTDAAFRVYTTGTDNDLRRVNSNEEARNQAPSGSEAQSVSSGTGAANSLAKWDGYLQWNPSEEIGFNMDLESKECQSVPYDSCKVKFTFSLPAGYTNFHQGSVQQQFYIKPCLVQSEECWDEENDDPVDPLDGTLYATGDGTSFETAFSATLEEDTWYIGTVRMQWNDELTSGSPYTRSGDGYTHKVQTWPTHNGTAYPSGGNAIIFEMPLAPVCLGPYDIGLGSSRQNACNDYPSSDGYKKQAGSFSSTYPHNSVWNSGCSTNPTGNFIAVNGVSYVYSSGTIVANPSPGDSAYQCEE